MKSFRIHFTDPMPALGIVNSLFLTLFYFLNRASILNILKLENASASQWTVVQGVFLFFALACLLLHSALAGMNRLFRLPFPLMRHIVVLFWFLMVFLVVVDLKVYLLTANHIFDAFVAGSILSKNVNREIGITRATFVTGAVAAMLIYGVELFLALVFSRLKAFFLKCLGLSFAGLAVCCAVCLFVMDKDRIGRNRTFFTPFGVSAKGFFFGRKPPAPALSIHDKYIEAGKRPFFRIENKRNLLVIQVESLRGDMMNDEFMPFLTSLYRRSTIQTRYHYSGSHVTEQGVFSLLYGLHSYNYPAFSANRTQSLALRVLKQNGYAVKGISASSLLKWKDSAFMFDGFDEFTEYTEEDPSLSDRKAVQCLKDIHARRNKSQPYCLYVFLNSTHHNYHYPPSYEIYTPVVDKNYNHFMGDDKLKAFKEKIFNRYKNSVRYMDSILENLYSIFKEEIDSNNLALIITGDHGEEFWDQCCLGHGASYLYNSRTRVPLVCCLPGKPVVKYNCTSSTELIPTLFDYLDVQPSLWKEWFSARSLLRQADSSDRFMLISSVDFPVTGKLCLINDYAKYWFKVDLERRSYDITDIYSYDDEVRASDPGSAATTRKQMDAVLREISQIDGKND
jgi:glucan phosphoethanolaminetransferase (alkaline phosphatase superfamily)